MKGMTPGKPIYTVKDVARKFGDRQVLKNITFSLYPGDRVGIVGVNGCGKSTLMKILGGEDKEFDGICVPVKGLSVGYVPQEPELDWDKTVRENVEDGVRHVREVLARLETVYGLYADPEYAEGSKLEKLMAEQADLEALVEVYDAHTIDSQIEIQMSKLQLPPPDRVCRSLSGGERRRVSICKTLLSKPDLLIMDEPTNHLDAETIMWLEDYLDKYPGSYILVTHDRYFLDRVATRMLEIDKGLMRSYEGNYSDYLEQKGKQKEIQDRTDANLLKALKRELEWIRQTPAGRRKKAKSRITAFHELEEEAANIDRPLEMELRLPFGPRLGDKVINVEHLGKSYGDKVLFKDLTFEIPPGAILGITGANGLGKSTLIKIITGQETPDSGEVVIGQNTKICYVDQTRETLDPSKTVYEEVSGGSEFILYGDKQLSIRHYLAKFLFSGSIQQTPVGKLSGGERNRVQLAKFLSKASNVVILDEPTNDLDLITLRVLEEALLSFPGCGIVITHDRYFLDRVATHILAFEGNQEIYFCYGSWDTYKERRQKGELGNRN